MDTKEDTEQLEQAMQFKPIIRPVQVIKNLLKKDNVFVTGTIRLKYNTDDPTFTFNTIMLDNPNSQEDSKQILFGGKIREPTPAELFNIQSAQDDVDINNDLFISQKETKDYYFLLFNNPEVKTYRTTTKLVDKDLTIIRLVTPMIVVTLLFVSGKAKHYLASTFNQSIRKNYYLDILYLLSNKLLGNSYEITYFTAGTDLDLLGTLQKVTILTHSLDTTIKIITENSTITLMKNSIKEVHLELPDDNDKVQAIVAFALNNGYLQVNLS